MKTIKLDARELATVLAGLRFWQRKQGALEEMPIATDMGTLKSLTGNEIDVLCERLNAPPPKRGAPPKPRSCSVCGERCLSNAAALAHCKGK